MFNWYSISITGTFGDDADVAWLKEETVKHHAGNSLCSLPKGKAKPSVIPAVESPHPGVSYNPSLKDHKSLLDEVVKHEMDKLKEEAHIARVTRDMFRKITVAEKQVNFYVLKVIFFMSFIVLILCWMMDA